MKGKQAIILFAVSVATLFCGCQKDNNPLTKYESYLIYGKVIGGLFNTGAPGLKVMRGDDVVYTDVNGNFNFSETSQYPNKDMFVTDTVNKTGSIFRSVSTGSCYLPHFVGNLNLNNISQATINVSLPGGMGNSNMEKVFFTNQFNINGIGNGGNCAIFLPEGNKVYGTVCVLLYTDNNGQVLSYDRFGIKYGVEINPGETTNLTFTDSMLTYNPPEVRVSGTITNVPPHSNSFPSFYMISLSPRNANYYFFDCAISVLNGNSFDILIPGNLPINYFPLLKINYSDSSNLQAFTSNINYLLPVNGGNNIIITNPDAPQILSPSPSTLIDSNTVFTLFTNYTDRIFHIIVFNSPNRYDIYTKENTFTLSDLYKLGLGGLNKNSSVVIGINAIGKYSSINDFVYSEYQNVSGYTSQPVQQTYSVKP